MCDKQLDDNEWHTISVVCTLNKPVEVTVDGDKFEVKTGERKDLQITAINFGAAKVNGDLNQFEGKVKEIKFSTNPPDRYKVVGDLYELTK